MLLLFPFLWKTLFPPFLKFKGETTSFVLLISLSWFCYIFIFPHTTSPIENPPYLSHPYHFQYCDSPISLSPIPLPPLRFPQSLSPISISLLWFPHTTLTHKTLTIVIPSYHSQSYHFHYCDGDTVLLIVVFRFCAFVYNRKKQKK